MAATNRDGSDVKVVPGVLTWGAYELGYSEDGVRLIIRNRHQPITPEELGETPLDYILLGGPVLAVFTAWQFDADTFQMLAGYAASAKTLTWTTDNVGKKLTDLVTPAALTFTPDSSGGVKWTGARAVPLLAEEVPFEIHNRPKDKTVFACAMAILPPAAGGTIVTVSEQP